MLINTFLPNTPTGKSLLSVSILLSKHATTYLKQERSYFRGALYVGRQGKLTITYSCIVLSQQWSMFLNYFEVKWTMPKHTAIYLVVGSGKEVARDRRPDGIKFHIAFGGQCGRRGIVGILKIYPIPFTRLNGIVLYLYIFGVKR